MTDTVEALARTASEDLAWTERFMPLIKQLRTEALEYLASDASRGQEDMVRGEVQAYRLLTELPDMVKNRDAERAEKQKREQETPIARRTGNPSLIYKPNK